MDRLIKIKKEIGLKDDFYIRYLNDKLEFLREEYEILLNDNDETLLFDNSLERDNYVILVRASITKIKYLLKQVK